MHPSQGLDMTAPSTLGGSEPVCRSWDTSHSICCSLLAQPRSAGQPCCKAQKFGDDTQQSGDNAQPC